MFPQPRTFDEQITFRIYPGRGNKRGLYWTVQVFRSFKEMRAHIGGNQRWLKEYWSARNTVACCTSWRKGRSIAKRSGVSKEMGEIILCQKRCGVRIVAHEVTHAMFRWMERSGIGLNEFHKPRERLGRCSKEEERLCYAVGDMCGQIYDVLSSKRIVPLGLGT